MMDKQLGEKQQAEKKNEKNEHEVEKIESNKENRKKVHTEKCPGGDGYVCNDTNVRDSIGRDTDLPSIARIAKVIK